MIFCERYDDGCWTSKPRHDAIPSLMKVSLYFLYQKEVLNIFFKTSSGVIPPPTISARRKRYSRICGLYRIPEIRTV